jgi:hypothetical protein
MAKKTKHITTAKYTLNPINKKANPQNVISKGTDRLSSYKDKKHVTIFHQNVRGVRRKTNKLLSHLYPDFPDFYVLHNTTSIN